MDHAHDAGRAGAMRTVRRGWQSAAKPGPRESGCKLPCEFVERRGDRCNRDVKPAGEAHDRLPAGVARSALDVRHVGGMHPACGSEPLLGHPALQANAAKRAADEDLDWVWVGHRRQPWRVADCANIGDE